MNAPPARAASRAAVPSIRSRFRWALPGALWLLLAAGAAPAALGAALQLHAVLPEQVHAEPDPRGWRLNFDVVVDNPGATPVSIDYLELEAYAADGALVTRRHLGGGGDPAAILMLPERLVPPGGRLQLFNPFSVLPADLEFTTLRFGIYHADGRLLIPITPTRTPPLVLPVLPLGGELFVESGSDLSAPHRRVSLGGDARVLNRRRNSGRFALDLTIIDDAGRYRSGARERPESWFAWGEAVRAPMEGRVVRVVDDVPDNVLLAAGGIRRPAPSDGAAPPASFEALGNHVVLEVAPDVHLVLAHLQQGAIAVAVGDRLWSGALVGRVGISGDASYPHLHVQLQHGTDLIDARPLPIAFACVRDLGGGVRRPAWLATGDRVAPCAIGRP